MHKYYRNLILKIKYIINLLKYNAFLDLIYNFLHSFNKL